MIDFLTILTLALNWIIFAIIAIVLYKIGKGWLVKQIYDASYKALSQFEKDSQSKAMMSKINETRNRYK